MGADLVIFISHANVSIDPNIPVPSWGLSEKGIKRHKQFNENPLVEEISSIYSSNEQKAMDGAKILSGFTNISIQHIESLGEMDRSSTGFLEEAEFQETVNMFFSNPTISIRGWEKAIVAQKRIVETVNKIIQAEKLKGHIAIVSHGGVGALLLCNVMGKPISRDYDQPMNGGGNYFCIEKDSMKLKSSWKDISDL